MSKERDIEILEYKIADLNKKIAEFLNLECLGKIVKKEIISYMCHYNFLHIDLIRYILKFL